LTLAEAIHVLDQGLARHHSAAPDPNGLDLTFSDQLEKCGSSNAELFVSFRHRIEKALNPRALSFDPSNRHRYPFPAAPGRPGSL
jgi:hypothetical protein